MRLKQVKRPYVLEWTIIAFISFIFCIISICEGNRLLDIGATTCPLVDSLFWGVIFILSVLGLLFRWQKEEAVNLDGKRYRLFNENKKLFLLYTGTVDGLSLVALIIFIQYISGRYNFEEFQNSDFWGVLLLVVIVVGIMAIINYNKYTFVSKSISE